MLIVRPVPRRRDVQWSALCSGEVTAVLVTAHVAAGGALPSLPWVLAMAAATFVAGLAVTRFRLRLGVAVPALVATQLALHTYLSALAPVHGTAAADGAMTHVHAAGHAPGLGLPMLVAHVVGGLATAVVWELRSRALEVLLTRTDDGLLPVPALRRRHRPTSAAGLGSGLHLVLLAPRRGPPVHASPA